MNCDMLDELVPVLARSCVLPRLYSLDLSMGTLVDPDVLVRDAAAFRHLAALELGGNLLDGDAADRITAVLDNVVIGAQRDDDGDRYVAEYE